MKGQKVKNCFMLKDRIEGVAMVDNLREILKEYFEYVYKGDTEKKVVIS